MTELLFGHGWWQCPGEQISFLELSKLIFEMFREFDSLEYQSKDTVVGEAVWHLSGKYHVDEGNGTSQRRGMR